MSFKREGNDKSQLNILKKRRVSDLLAHFIPEDEAALMKNGRYSCLVCSYRPVFDTVDMLTVHRKGKKHLEGLKTFYSKKSQLKAEITKRKHEKYVEAEEQTQEASSSAPLLTRTRKLTHHALLKTAPYDSRHRRTSTKSEPEPASCNKHDRTASLCQKTKASRGNPATESDVHRAPKPDVHRAPKPDVHRAPKPDVHRAPKADVHRAPKADVHRAPKADVPPGSPADDKDETPRPAEEKPRSSERRRELEHYLKLKSDGWLQDGSGRWVKDHNVEFDSDEDEPASVPTR